MNTAMVTGANGFIGFRTVLELLKRGVEVFAVIRREGPNRFPLHPKLHVIFCSLEEISSLRDKIQRKSIDVFYHFAWEGVSGANMWDYNLQLNNAKYTCDAVKVAKQLSCKKFINAGSIMEYECIADSNIPNRKPRCVNMYGPAKLVAHFMAETIAIKEGIDFVSVIISNVYGEGEVSERFIISTLKKLIRGERVACTSGEQLYDFIHIDDASDALCLVGENGQNLMSYYIGSPAPKPLKEFIKEMWQEVNPQAEVAFGEVLFNGVSLTYKEFDMNKIYHDFGFLQKVSFADGINRTAGWLRTGDIIL